MARATPIVPSGIVPCASSAGQYAKAVGDVAGPAKSTNAELVTHSQSAGQFEKSSPASQTPSPQVAALGSSNLTQNSPTINALLAFSHPSTNT